VFDDVKMLSNHLYMHEEAEPETGSHLHEGHEESVTRPRGQVSLAYVHADREFKSARVPIFGIVAVFLVTFGAASALRVALFAPMFVASVIAMIIGAAFLFKYLMEG
jgi:hypothetical protein